MRHHRSAVFVALALTVACNGGPAKDVRDPSPANGGGEQPPEDDIRLAEDVRVIVEPSDDGAALLDAIQKARISVYVTMYLFTSPTLLNALIVQHHAGRDVKVVLNRHFPVEGMDNSYAFDMLSHAGVPVAWAPDEFTYTHEKCVIIDHVAAWIMTMNATKTSALLNREYIAVDHELDDVVSAEAVFAADFHGYRIRSAGNLVLAPENAQRRLLTFLSSATSSVDLEGESLSDPRIVDELVNARRRGLVVHVILPAKGEPSPESITDQLLREGVSITRLSVPYLHAKAIVVDRKRAYVGSANFTSTSLLSNRELGVLTEAREAVSGIISAIDSDRGL